MYFVRVPSPHVSPEQPGCLKIPQVFLRESNLKSLRVVCLSAWLQDSALFRISPPGIHILRGDAEMCHRSGANQLRNFIAHSNPKKQAWKIQEKVSLLRSLQLRHRLHLNLFGEKLSHCICWECSEHDGIKALIQRGHALFPDQLP